MTNLAHTSPDWTRDNSALWLGEGTTKHKLLCRVTEELLAMGWRVQGWDAPDDKGVGVYTITVVKGKPVRRMSLTVRTEWPRNEAPVDAVFVDGVDLIGYPETKNIVTVPSGDETDSIVTRDDPVTTAVALDLYTDEELWQTFSHEARKARADRGLRESAADVMRDLLD